MNRRTDHPLPVPDEAAWEQHPEDLDWGWAKKQFFGLTLEQAAPLFGENPIERAEDLRFMPKRPFQYYIRAYAAFLLSDQALTCQEPYSAASCFLNLLEEKYKEGRGFVTPALLEALLPAAEHVAAKQEAFEADVDIFGDFWEQVGRIKNISNEK